MSDGRHRALADGRHRTRPDRRHRRLGRVLAAALTLLVAAAAPAFAYWTASSSGMSARAQASTLTAPTLTAGSVTATSVALSWTKPFAATGYTLAQSPGTLSGCSAAPTPTTAGCTATSLIPNTTYTWTLTAFYQNWSVTATASATTTKQATTTTLSNLTPTTANAGTAVTVKATVAGTSGYGTPAGTVAFSLFTSSTCTGTAAYVSGATTLSGGTATGSLTPGVGTYYWRATYTPTDTYNLTSTSACNTTAVTINPTSTMVFNYVNGNLADYDVNGRPTAVTAGLSVQNTGGSVPRTLTSLTVVMTVPDTRFAGVAPTSVTGTSWSYTGVSHVGSTWVYTFTWSGSLAVYGSTSDLAVKIPLSNNSPGSFNASTSASNFYATTITMAGTINL